MGKRGVLRALVVAFLAAWALDVLAGGVFIVSRKGVESYNDAKSGFIQMAYSLQIPGFNPKVVELDGTAADDAALASLKAQAPDLVYAVGSLATKKVRQAIPDVWIVYGMVYYPEAEGFTGDPKMCGVASLGPTKPFVALLKTLTKAKSMAVLYARPIEPSVAELVSQFKNEGLDAVPRPVADSAGLQAAFDGVKDQVKAVMILPDPVMASQDAVRFLVSQCVGAGLAPVTLSESLVASGALCAAFYTPDTVGNQAARVASEILKSGRAPADKLVAPAEFSTALNKGTAEAMKIVAPKNLRVEITYE